MGMPALWIRMVHQDRCFLLQMRTGYRLERGTMTTEEAIKILDPATTRDALWEIEYYAGFNGEEAKMAAVEEACRMAVKALKGEQK